MNPQIHEAIPIRSGEGSEDRITGKRSSTRTAVEDKKKLYDSSKLCSVDFVMTGRRTENVHTYAPAGFAQPREGGGYSRYTDCIFTAIWADVEDRTPTVLYTFDPRYRTDKLNT